MDAPNQRIIRDKVLQSCATSAAQAHETTNIEFMFDSPAAALRPVPDRVWCAKGFSSYRGTDHTLHDSSSTLLDFWSAKTETPRRVKPGPAGTELYRKKQVMPAPLVDAELARDRANRCGEKRSENQTYITRGTGRNGRPQTRRVLPENA